MSSPAPRAQPRYTGGMSTVLAHRRLSYDELCALPDDGNQYELLDGEPIVSPAPFVPHQRLVGRLHIALSAAAGDEAEVLLAPCDVIFDQYNVLQPDLLVVRKEHAGVVQDHVRGVPDLIVEVLSSPARARLDRKRKMEIYARFGVPEYWIVDGGAQAIEVYRRDAEGRALTLAATCRSGDRAMTPVLPRLAVDVGALFAG